MKEVYSVNVKRNRETVKHKNVFARAKADDIAGEELRATQKRRDAARCVGTIQCEMCSVLSFARYM